MDLPGSGRPPPPLRAAVTSPSRHGARPLASLAQPSGEVSKQSLGVFERLVDRRVQVLLLEVRGRVLPYDELAPGDGEIDPAVVPLAVLMMPVGRFDHDAARDNPVEDVAELGGAPRDVRLDRVRVAHVAEGDLEVHGEKRATGDARCKGATARRPRVSARRAARDHLVVSGAIAGSTASASFRRDAMK
jgi:hypothetical protein